MMKYSLLIIFLFLTFQKFIVQNLKETCNGIMKHGIVSREDKCSIFDEQSNFYAKLVDNVNHFEVYQCDYLCKDCQLHHEFKYGCNQTNIAIEKYFGEPSKLSDTGFFISIYQSEELCQKDVEKLYIDYFVEEQCLSDGFLNSKFSSQKIGYKKEMKGVLFQEYTDSNCVGKFRRYFFPLNQCTPFHHFHIRVKRKIQ